MKNLPGAQTITHIVWACFVSDAAGPSHFMWPLFLLFIHSPLCSHFPSSTCVLVVNSIISPVSHPLSPLVSTHHPPCEQLLAAVVVGASLCCT
jgi:hypothetical protein